MARRVLLACLCATFALNLAVAIASAPDSAGASTSTADKVTNTYFRPQEVFMTNDASTEENIPGLEPTDVNRVKRAIPNLEQLSPFLTMLSVWLPSMMHITNALGIYLVNNWNLAYTGPTDDWLLTVIVRIWEGIIGVAERPILANTFLIAAPEAYQQLSSDLRTYGGVTGIPINPLKQQKLASAVFHQLAANLILPRVPLLATATNGTLVRTLGDVMLTLMIKDDGRYLVSNTTTAKLLETDIQIGPHTFCVVDRFIVPRISLVPRPLPPLLTDEDKARMPQYIRMYQDSLRQLPGAVRSMPGDWGAMIKQQLPPKVRSVVETIEAQAEALRARLPSVKFTQVPASHDQDG